MAIFLKFPCYNTGFFSYDDQILGIRSYTIELIILILLSLIISTVHIKLSLYPISI